MTGDIIGSKTFTGVNGIFLLQPSGTGWRCCYFADANSVTKIHDPANRATVSKDGSKIVVSFGEGGSGFYKIVTI